MKKNLTKMPVLILLLLFGTACSSRKAVSNIEDKRIEAVASENELLRSQLAQLIERIFVLEDRIETLSVRQDKRGSFPTQEASSARVMTSLPNPKRQVSTPSPEASPKNTVVSKAASPIPTASIDDSFLGVGKMDAKKPSLTFSNADLKNSDGKKAPARPIAKKNAISQAKKSGPATPLQNTIPKSDEDPEAISEYNNAYALYAKAEYNQAKRAFLSFVRSYPDHTYSDNAIFWIAESYYRQGEFAPALTYYQNLIKNFPRENKVPEAMYRVVECHIRLKQTQHAQQSFDVLMQTFPTSFFAKQAKIEFKSFLAQR